jgi:glycosyltransferase involved in cell wall biosynthesis
MNILFIRITNRISGAEKYNYYLIEALKKYTDINPIIITDCEEFAKEIRDNKYTVYIFPLSIKEIGTKRDIISVVFQLPIYLITYIKIIKNLNSLYHFRIICLESMTEKIFLTILLKILLYKVIWIEHGPLFITQRAWIIKKLYMLNSYISDKIISVSNNTKKDLIQGGVSQGKIQTLYIGVNIKDFQLRNINKTILPNNKKIVGYIGTLNKEKGIIDFVHLAKQIIKIDSNIIFLIVGDGSLNQYIRSYIRHTSIRKNFLFTGYIKDIRPYIKKMNIIIYPTHHYEGLSITILEALAMGKIVFARDIGGNSELIHHGKTGYLYKIENTELVKLILNKIYSYDEQKRIAYYSILLIKKHFNQQIQSMHFRSLFHSL